MPSVSYSLRPASAGDYEFLYRLFVTTMRDSIVQVWGEWDEPRWAAFFRDHFRPDAYQVVVVGGIDVGALAIERRPDAVYLDTIEIAPAHQGRGLGTQIIQDVLTDAWAAGLPVTLQVNRANRSRRLYERLGFVEIGHTDTHYLMRASPPADS